MSVESRRNHKDPEVQGSRRWQRFRQWLGAVGSRTEREENGPVGNDLDKDGSPTRAEAALNRIEQARLDETPARFTQPFSLGASAYSDPKFFRPQNGGVPLAEDEHYQRALKILDELEPPHVSAQRYK